MTTLPPDIEVLEPAAGAFRERQFRLPVRTHEAVRRNYLHAIIVASALFFVPIAAGAGVTAVDYVDSGELKSVGGFAIAFFGSFLFPLAGILLLTAIIHRWSRCELIVAADRLVVRGWLGPFFRTRRLRLAGLKGLRVQIGRLQIVTMRGSAPFDPKSILCNVGTLYADFENSPQQMICSGYDADWLLSLAYELSRVVEANNSASGALWPVTLTHEDPRIIIERTEQPSTSDARVQSSADRLIIDLPARGWWQTWPKQVIYFCFFCVALLLAWTVFLVRGELIVPTGENGEQEPLPLWLGLLIGSPCYAIFACLFVAWCSMARFSARWEITPHQLCLWQRTLWGESVDLWQRTKLQSIRVISQSIGEQNDHWITCLQIASSDQPPRELFRERDKSELEWLATVLSKGAGLSPEPVGCRENPVKKSP